MFPIKKNIRLRAANHIATDPKNITGPLANHFKSIFNLTYLTVTSSQSATSDFLPTAPISFVEDSKVIKCLKISKCMGVDRIPYFIISGSSHIFIPYLTFVFSFNVTSETLPSLWKQDVLVPVFK
jgi:hypothetical protein